MKLLRFGSLGNEQPAVLDDNGAIRSLEGHVDDITPQAIDVIRQIDVNSLPKIDNDVRLGACVSGVGKFICIGLNYADHAAESGMEVPSEPVIFMKATSALCGPNDSIVKPRGSTKLDWEVELGVVVGRELKYATESEASEAIAGYCVINDISERAFQLERCGQWVKGKSADTFGPAGPWLVTADEVEDTSNLAMWLTVNGHRYQNGNTSTMVYKPVFLLAYLSQFMSLQAGDIISTGTPPGVGLGQNPPVYLAEGDVVELGIEGLGTQRQTVINAQ